MSTGECDIASDRTAEKRQDRCSEFSHRGCRHNRLFQRQSDRRLNDNDHNEDDNDHDTAEDLCQCVHGIQRILHQEDHDRYTARDEVSCDLRYAQQRVKAESASAYIADIEYKSARNDQKRYHIAESGEHLVRHVLPPHA